MIKPLDQYDMQVKCKLSEDSKKMITEIKSSDYNTLVLMNKVNELVKEVNWLKIHSKGKK